MASRPRVNPFSAPKPKGKNPGHIPKSERYVPPDQGRRASASARRAGNRRQDVADDEEAAAFAPRAGREVPAGSPRNRLVSAAALDASRRRMTGNFDPDGETTRHHRELLADAEGDAGDIDPDEPPEFQRAALEERDNAYTIERIDEEIASGVQAVIDELKRAGKWHEAPPPPLRVSPVPPAPPVVELRKTQTSARVPQHPADEFAPTAQQTQQQAHTQALPKGALVHPSGLIAMPVRVGDVDRLWDWLRADADKGQAFLGKPMTTSVALHAQIRFLVEQTEPEGVAIIRSLYWHEEHFGFAMLAPILAADRTALLHIYLKKDARGALATLVQALVELAEQAVPGMHLAVSSADATWARLHRSLLAPLGFVEHTMFVR